MMRPQKFVLSLLPKCKNMCQLNQLHGMMVTTSMIKSIIPISKLIDFCVDSKSGDMDYASLLFRHVDVPSVYIWNSMIRGYANSSNPRESILLYRQMIQNGYPPDHFTFPFVLKASSAIADQDFGKCIHNCMVKSGFEEEAYATTCLLHMYVSCADIKSGLKVFDAIPKSNVVAWTCLIGGYVNNNMAGTAIDVFKEMDHWRVEPNEITMVNVLIACARSRDIDTGQHVHDRIRKSGHDPFMLMSNSNIILATAMLEMYAKCGSLRIARDLFNKMPHKNIVAWNTMISAYNQYERYGEALKLFFDLWNAGFCLDKATFLSVLSVCAHLCALSLGQTVHACLLKCNMATDAAIATALLNMYAKSGELSSAKKIFNRLQKKDVVVWTSMINGLALHGYGNEALSIFQRMLEDSTLVPDHITYVGVLFACSHMGLIEEAQTHFNSMTKVYGILPEREHYGCMVDLLSRAGHFGEVQRLIETMSIKPNIPIWGSLLNGCCMHGNIVVANQVKGHLRELEPGKSGVHILLSNIYSMAGRLEEVHLTRKLMKHKKITKTVGHSSVEVKLLTS
ncbi:putative pentatricopeptide repeat-containing protein At3g05240 [Neltuma alba]|uniref:putative pentatricopeptide repeat-containing protein At3g05240 n=1 Tax=Neltuma alba TaxID=207710 RepID=UPI0010A3CCF9|nr:putative pentatricopeptide repeat-containing protein At3g05240 [Prosopis alba]XP_028802765.1 putative pentatricopeptide repeat-containing protein At3g05240 [Prosopis alba]XP_028802766.1 putative pentatricopeptide repeat-containing protein At3g05240 [Prosopis alba]XP_028802767.1 putative pentatricopeptide repeat-containing protein At3g05240 [Prosopis alba]